MPGVIVVGLGPAGLDSINDPTRSLLEDPARRVIVRTSRHPAVSELGRVRDVETCDDLYESSQEFDDLYRALADRVLEAGREHDVVYAVPGSPLVGERSVFILCRLAAEAGVPLDVLPGQSFLDPALAAVDLDPLERGVQVLDGRALPDPLILHVPTFITQVDQALVLADIQAALTRTLPPETRLTVLADLGADSESVEEWELGDLHEAVVGPRTTLYLDPPPSGWVGLVETNRRLRRECPWDSRQTHHSLVKHLVEETYETVEALSSLPPSAPGGQPDYGAYAEVEEELGDLLLQVVFHTTLAREAGAFDVEEVAEGIRRKLVDRHPHVFGDVDVSDAEEVLGNWERLKREEKDRDSLMDGIPASLPALVRAERFQQRAATVGFDWARAVDVIDKVQEESQELRAVVDDAERAGDELGDLLFSAVNLARHLGVDAELALRRSADRFAERFRSMEAAAESEGASLSDLTPDELEERWEQAKDADG